MVILEHRYWGELSLFSELTVKNLRYLTLENSVRDLGYFARNFSIPDYVGDNFDSTINGNGSSLGNVKSPWIIYRRASSLFGGFGPRRVLGLPC